MKFSKMHGLGNDFILVNATKEILPEDLSGLADKICEPRFGIGADGLIVLNNVDGADFSMRIFNSDGSEAEMCGNGIRCAAIFAREEGLTPKTKMSVATKAGLIKPEIIFGADDVPTAVRVDMGEPRLKSAEIPCGLPGDFLINREITANGETFFFTGVSMGNPHCVIFVDDVANFPVQVFGPVLENHVLFPAKANIEFVQVLAKNHLKMRVWERGCGETMACGTGACASVVAAFLNKKANRQVVIELLGGELIIDYNEDGKVYMTGPYAHVFDGDYAVDKKDK